MRKSGFTLIELMIVVAIIGFLALIAIPSYKKFLAKAKRTEAYMNLSALATAEKIYHAEHGSYTTDIQALGWKPEGAIQYTYGFGGAEGKNYVAGRLNAGANELVGARADKDGFVAVAAGDIDGDGQADVISIDQNNEIKIVKDDLN
jgi:prepilin-type N-terminal cleavage/methylation domain-containing protein